MATLRLFHSVSHDVCSSNNCSYDNLSTTVLENCPVTILVPTFAKVDQLIQKLKLDTHSHNLAEHGDIKSVLFSFFFTTKTRHSECNPDIVFNSKSVVNLDIVGTVYHLVIYMQSNKIHKVF